MAVLCVESQILCRCGISHSHEDTSPFPPGSRLRITRGGAQRDVIVAGFNKTEGT